MYRYLKSLLRAEGIEAIKSKKMLEKLENIFPNKKYSFGKKNKNIKFYVIKRNYNFNGFFSNLIFVIDHLKFAKKNGMVPVVDMENFKTVYNDLKEINKTSNSWNYYFKKISKYSLSEVYRSENVYFSSDKRIFNKEINEDRNLIKIYQNYIKILPIHIKLFKKIRKNKFRKKNKILGIHIRGGLEKIVRGHSLPPRPQDILKISVEIFGKHKCDKIFLVTEDLNYLEVFRDYFKNKIITLDTPRSKSKMFGSHNLHFTNYNRTSHRYKLGREALIDALMLSSTNVSLFTTSNLWRFSIIMSKKKKVVYQVKTGSKSKNRLIARWQWYLKYLFPSIFGNINCKIVRLK
tara:strand:+ start:1988 stop:3031 length:1044 start_codon:yes stop_codon:yes gene_type:complete